MEKKSIKILLDAQNIFMARNDLNFTDDILKEINNSIK
jgi:Skp family chaperone for outer membrane proteins